MGLQILKDRFLTNPERWYGDYVEALANSKDLCIDSDRIDEAIKIAEHDRVIRGDLYLSNPERWAEDYVIALSHLGGLYSHVNRSDEAIALTKERLEILKPLYEKDPEQWAEDYMIVLRDLAVLYRKIGRSHESKDLRKLRRRIDRGRTQPSGFVFLHRIRDKMQIFGFGRSHSDQDARASEHTE
jgi:tetratricopeptide (TPR) repeat protein